MPHDGVHAEALWARLRHDGIPDVPTAFSVAMAHQTISRAVVDEIDAMLAAFERVTTGPGWQRAVTASAPEIARSVRRDVSFFSAWDIHVPEGAPHDWKLIECNDNGSGFLFAALLNRAWYELSGSTLAVEPPEPAAVFAARVASMVRAEGEAFFQGPLPGMVLVLDDAESLARGRFRHELARIRDALRGAGFETEIASPDALEWRDERLFHRGKRVAFVVNRATDFFWDAEVFAPVRAAYAKGDVFIAPNPFTYATRSDKRLFAILSAPHVDEGLGAVDDLMLLRSRIPFTSVVTADDVAALARDKAELFFKPCHGFASHGVLTGDDVGETRLRRLVKASHPYVAQRRAPKHRIDVGDGVAAWADLRVWAHRGRRYLMSGRASRGPDGVDLSPPGGWLPTFRE